MNDNAKRWVAELRSGKWKQGKINLCHDDHYCCLGVACEMYCTEVKDIKEVNSDGIVFYGVGNTCIMPAEVQTWLGLAGVYGSNKEGTSLVHKNDQGVPFSQIADFIESEPEGLFA